MPPITKLKTELTLDSRRFNRGIGSSRKKLAGFTNSLGSVQAQLVSVFGAAGTGFLVKKAISTMADFEAKMSGLKAVTGATSKEMKKMTKVARDLGSKTAFSATQAADGMEFLARAGFKTNEIIESIPGVLNLAAAGAIDLGRAADISSNILGAFSLKAEEMSRVVDVMAKTTASANTDIEQLGEAMKLSAPIANSFGVSIEETAAAIGILSNSGLQGTVAGTGLKNVLLKLISPSNRLKEAMGGLTLKSDGLVAVLKRIRSSGLDSAEAMKIFGKIGGNAFLVLNDGVEGLKELDKQLKLAGGTAETMAKIKMDNLTGAFLGFKSAVDEVVLVLGDMGVLEALRRLMDNMATSTRNAGKAMREFAKSFDTAFGVFGDRDDFSSIDAAIKRERERLKALQEAAQLAAKIPGSNFEEIEKQIEQQVRFLAQLIKLKKLGVQPSPEGKVSLEKSASPVKNQELDSAGGSFDSLKPSGDFFPHFAIDPGVLKDLEDLNAKLMQHKALEQEITAELRREAELLTILASGNKELFALKEKQFELEDRLGRKLSENETLKLQAFITETEQLRKTIEENEKTGETIKEVWEAVGRHTEDAIVNALTGAQSAMEGFRDIALAILEDIMREIIRVNLTTPLFGKEGGIVSSIGSLIGFAHGGSFTVPGSGGTDSSPVSFMATPGERVDIRTPGQVANDGNGDGDVNTSISISNTVNITESGVSSNTSTRGGANGLAKTLGDQMKQLVTKIIIDERRAGGLLPLGGA